MLKIFSKLLIGLATLLLITQLNACSTLRSTHDGAPSRNVDFNKIPNAVPKVEPLSKYGNPRSYVVRGKRIYVLHNTKHYNKVGFASWYGTKFHGKLTSTREPYDLYAMTAASRDLPIPCYVQVTNLTNGRTVIVRVNDRGPFVGSRIIDLSYVAAEKLGYANHGTALVRVTAIDPHLWAQRDNIMPTTVVNAPPSDNNYFLQVGAFAKLDNAELYKQRITALTSLPVSVKTGYHHQTPIYRVQIGPVAASQSVQLQAKLENEGLGKVIHVIG